MRFERFGLPQQVGVFVPQPLDAMVQSGLDPLDVNEHAFARFGRGDVRRQHVAKSREFGGDAVAPRFFAAGRRQSERGLKEVHGIE